MERLQPGQIVGKSYRLQRQLGHGGSSVVWSADDLRGGPQRALKFLKHFQRERRARFEREVRVLGRLRHPNIVQPLEVLEFEQAPVLVMELLNGETLRQRLETTYALPTRAACSVLAPVAEALHAAHRQSIVHRDLKPENVFLVGTPEDQSVKLLDFGTAKPLAEASTGSVLTELGALVGTLWYMAPEQVLGLSEIGPAADAWSFGVLLYEALAGFRPIEGTSRNEVVRRTLTQAIVPLDVVHPDAAPPLCELVGKLLLRQQEERLSDLACAARVLRQVLAKLE